MDEIEFVKNVSVLEIKKGDLIVLKSPNVLSDSARFNLKDSMKKVLEDNGIRNFVIVLEEGMEIGVIRDT